MTDNLAPSAKQKFNTVILKNTFYFYNQEFEETYEGYVNSIKETLLVLQNQIQNTGLRKELFEPRFGKLSCFISKIHFWTFLELWFHPKVQVKAAIFTPHSQKFIFGLS